MRKSTLCFSNRSGTKGAEQAQKIARVWKFYVNSENLGTDQFHVIMQNAGFSLVAAHFNLPH